MKGISGIRCQLCGVSGNVGRMRLATEPAEAAARCTAQGVPVPNEADCDGCFVVTNDGTEDADDAADVTFMPSFISDDEGSSNDESMSTKSSAVGEDTSHSISGVDGDDSVEMKIDKDSKSYAQFLSDLPWDNCNIIVPLTEEYRQRDQTWRIREHIPGPNCMLRNAYSGQNISKEEIQGCNTLQLLCPKPSDWVAEPGDEDFELDAECPYYLSGLRDHLDGTPSATIFSPIRHNQEDLNISYWIKAGEHQKPQSMPFHPACFEIFKRASLNRFNTIDVKSLMNWYQAKSTYYTSATEKIFAQDEAVRRATEAGGWTHVQGDEWIAANPCFVQALEVEMQDLSTQEPFKGSRLSESRDINAEIDEIAQMNLLSEVPADLPQSFYFGQIRQDMPWIWEAWCTRPYSGWTTKAQSDIEKDPVAIRHQRDYLRNWIEVLKSDTETSTRKRAQLRDLNAQIRQLEAEHQFIPEPVPPVQLPRHGTDWRKLYFSLNATGVMSNGLRNRERVWRHCNSILDSIETWRVGGKDATQKRERRKVAPPNLTCYRQLGLSFPGDYSEGEAEFSDEELISDDEDMEMGDH
ncbi:hypothetical protein NQ176_g3721 [Zarea fungicola]|uniref:Uncharacterized protein n=1 Tax=Zarea fungicola TaxID=93591 RepID=A0ACC1NIH2_9HYPO|nr:hypothetical protein NQ176_g3721 [Lecanicillium fungicola]